MARTSTTPRQKVGFKAKRTASTKRQKTIADRVAFLEKRVAALVKELKVARDADEIGLIAAAKGAREAAMVIAAAAKEAETVRTNLQDAIKDSLDKARTMIDQWRVQVFEGTKT